MTNTLYKTMLKADKPLKIKILRKLNYYLVTLPNGFTKKYSNLRLVERAL